MPKGHIRIRRKRRTEAQWNETLRQFESSGLSLREFCRREDVNVSSLQRWRARTASSSPRTQFVELMPSSRPDSTALWTLELSLPNGVCLRLRG